MKKRYLFILPLLLAGCDALDPGEHMAVAQTNFASAYVNVARDIEEGRIALFATVPGEPSQEEVDGFTVRVYFDPTIQEHHRKWSGSYHNHHNNLVLRYSAGYASEYPELFDHVTQLLQEFHPDFEWSHPTLGNMTIQRIRQLAEESPEELNEFFEASRFSWDHGKPDFQQIDDSNAEKPPGDERTQ